MDRSVKKGDPAPPARLSLPIDLLSLIDDASKACLHFNHLLPWLFLVWDSQRLFFSVIIPFLRGLVFLPSFFWEQGLAGPSYLHPFLNLIVLGG